MRSDTQSLFCFKMSNKKQILLARNAMATRFEIILVGDDEIYLRAAGEEVLNEIERIESRISPFKPESEIFLINQNASIHPVRVSIEVFNLLKIAKEIWLNTKGAFDPTIGPLMKLWGFRENSANIPSREAIEKTMQICGMHLVELDEKNSTVKFLKKGVRIDLGAIGKGYAIDHAVNILKEAEITSAFIHGGTSSAAALGCPQNSEAWKISIEIPPHLNMGVNGAIALVELFNSSFSVSAIWGRIMKSENETFGHIIDPITGLPVKNCILAATRAKSATYADALSTAILVLGKEICKDLLNKYPDLNYLYIVNSGDNAPIIYSYGIELFDEVKKYYQTE